MQKPLRIVVQPLTRARGDPQPPVRYGPPPKPRPPRASLALAASLFAAAAAAQHDGVVTANDRPAVDYLRDVRPILAQHCYRCHGPDANERKAELRLDLRADAFADRDGVPAFVTGAADRSEAFVRITSDDPDRSCRRRRPTTG